MNKYTFTVKGSEATIDIYARSQSVANRILGYTNDKPVMRCVKSKVSLEEALAGLKNPA